VKFDDPAGISPADRLQAGQTGENLIKRSGNVMKNLKEKNKGDKIVYTSCYCNCGCDHNCVFKAHVRDGVVVAVEPDDRVNTGVGREDEVLSDEELIRTHLQRRPCTKGLVFHKHIYHPDRALYPLKRDPNSKRGEGKFIRISWEEALTIVANKMNEAREKYGPYSTMTSFVCNSVAERLFSLWGAGVDGWGWSSFDSARLAANMVAGETGWNMPGYVSGSPPDMLANAKLLVIWGWDPTTGLGGPGFQFAWFIKLARERGKKVIIIDPRYTPGAAILADQWIPIKPGTDIAMFMAMAYVLFKEDWLDKEFVAKYVEPKGFEKWKSYILGLEDGIEKTPKWAENKCAVPAETIHELTKLVASVKPSWLWSGWGVNRKSRGENTVRAFAALQAMLGYWGIPGAGPSIHSGAVRPIPWGQTQQGWWGPSGEYRVPKLYRSQFWAQAILLLEKVRSGELSEKDYMRMVGWRADPAIVKKFNPRVLFWGQHMPFAGNHLVTGCDSANDQIKAMEKMELIVTNNGQITPTARYADIIFPVQEGAWEEKNILKTIAIGFESINYCPGVIKAPGEAKPLVWIYTKLAEKLGIDPKKFFKYYTTDENWEEGWERYQQDRYQMVVDYYKKRDISLPSWEEFTKGKFINCDELEDKPFTGWNEQMKEGKPFKTESGKIEIYSNYLANDANRGKGEHYDSHGQVYDLVASDWGSLMPMPVYQRVVKGMDDPRVKDYPLMMLSPHPRYRVHSLFWDHPWLRNHVYQHRVWISTTDAKARGIKDGDRVLVHNERGKVVMPAYVTGRIMPGIIVIRHGGKYLPDENGVDFGAAPATLLGGDFESSIVPAKTTTLVQVKKYEDIP
jgi:anaerobic dimethyl sulfoxide reductase subunit A